VAHGQNIPQDNELIKRLEDQDCCAENDLLMMDAEEWKKAGFKNIAKKLAMIKTILSLTPPWTLLALPGPTRGSPIYYGPPIYGPPMDYL
jgi:hypothetical protein